MLTYRHLKYCIKTRQPQKNKKNRNRWDNDGGTSCRVRDYGDLSAPGIAFANVADLTRLLIWRIQEIYFRERRCTVSGSKWPPCDSINSYHPARQSTFPWQNPNKITLSTLISFYKPVIFFINNQWEVKVILCMIKTLNSLYVKNIYYINWCNTRK